MIKVTALGTGVCSSHYDPSADCRREKPGFLINCDGYRILLDCSEDIAFRLEERGIPMESINLIAISHAHPDHNALIHFIQSVFAKGLWGGEKMEKLNVIMPNYLIDNFPTWWKIYIPETEAFEFPILAFARPNKTHSINSANGVISIQSIPVYHGFGKTESYAFRIQYQGKVIAYSGDTGVCAGIGHTAFRADLFICEASARIGDNKNAFNYGHLTPFQAGNIARIEGVKKLFLTHYTGLDSMEAMIEDCRKSGYTGELIIGYDTYTETL